MGNTHVMGRRVVAALVDVVMLAGAFVVVGIVTGSAKSSSGNLSIDLKGGAALLYCVIWIAYFVLLEWLLGGTIGKLMVALRVRSTEGGRISFWSSLGRNLLRIVDAFPYFIPYLLGFIIAMTGSDRQRVGDRAASSVVVTAAP